MKSAFAIFRSTRTSLVLAAGLISALAVVRAAELPSGWRYSQELPVPQSGLVKLSVPLESLSAAQPNLEDLRLHDSAGREVPFLLEHPVERPPAARRPQQFRVTVKPDTTVVILETGAADPIQDVTLQSPARDFLKGVRIEGSKNGTSWQTLETGQLVFRQPDGVEKMRVTIPPGVWPWLRLTLEDQRSPAIPLTGAELLTAGGPRALALPLDVVIDQRVEEPGQTRLSLRFPGMNFTLAGLTLETDEPLFARPVTLLRRDYAEGEVRETVFHRASLYRVALAGQPPASNLTCAVDVPVRSREVTLTLDHGDNPPLPIAAVRAQRRPVYLTFLASQPGTYRLLSGNGQCPAPRYDLAGMRSNLISAALVSFTPGPLATNAAWRPTDALASLDTAGAAIDVAPWRYRKRVQLELEGVQQIELDLETLAATRGGLDDVRLVRAGFQVPWVVERTGRNRAFSPPVRRVDDPKRSNVSRWELVLPCAGPPLVRLTCTTKAAYFKRSPRLLEERRNELGERTAILLGSANWVRSPGQKETRLTLPFSTLPETSSLVVEIDHGDNPTIEFQDFELWYPVTRLLCKTAADGALFLYYGNPAAGPPRYDVELLASRLLASDKSPATLGPQETLKPGRGKDTGERAGWIFWLTLGLVVAALLFIIARLLPARGGDATPG